MSFFARLLGEADSGSCLKYGCESQAGTIRKPVIGSTLTWASSVPSAAVAASYHSSASIFPGPHKPMSTHFHATLQFPYNLFEELYVGLLHHCQGAVLLFRGNGF
jgi:hypothetical protein